MITKEPNKHDDLCGLVLAGGKSVRMGADKGLINWHGLPQREYLYNLLSRYCTDVYISCREDQINTIDSRCNILTDKVLDRGPLNGILTALEHHPEKAWLIVACDLPLVDEATLEFLLKNRQISKDATAFLSSTDNLPEPVITIWESKIYSKIPELLSKNIKCPRKILIHSDIHSITSPNPKWLINSNTPEDALYVKSILNNNS